MKALCDRLEALVRYALVVLVTVMVSTVGWQVFSRLMARASVALELPQLVEPSRWTEELAGFQLAWLALLGAVYALRRGAHPGFDLLYSKMPPGARRLADLTTFALIACFAALVLTYGGLRLMLMTLELHQRTAALHWPMGLVYSVIPASGILMTLFAIEGFVARLGASPPPETGQGVVP
jgi:TRAP-type C4-dicarboxylate transport system permease small subunit